MDIPAADGFAKVALAKPYTPVSKRVAEAMEARAEVGQEAAEAVVELRGELVLAFVAPNADRTTATPRHLTRRCATDPIGGHVDDRQRQRGRVSVPFRLSWLRTADELNSHGTFNNYINASLAADQQGQQLLFGRLRREAC